MREAIVGLVMTVEEIEGGFKLNQHKSDVDHAAIASALVQPPDEAAQTIGKQTVELRPQVDYKSTSPASVSAAGWNAPSPSPPPSSRKRKSRPPAAPAGARNLA